MSDQQRILALCGGVGGAKLAAGLADCLGSSLTVVVNTGDDFTHLGLRICPDLDSVCYALSGLNDPVRGWGRANESWAFMTALTRLGGPAWFQLGDRDLAMHVLRSTHLNMGSRLTQTTTMLASEMAISAHVVPMTDDIVATIVETDEGSLAFQDYFVARQCRPRLREVRFDGVQAAAPAPELLADDYDAIIICPSNPFVSIDPILALPGVREVLANRTCPLLAVSPFIGGHAIKGPAAKMFAELGLPCDAASLVRHYGGLLDLLVIDSGDDCEAGGMIEVHRTEILMRNAEDRERLARICLDLVAKWSRYATS